MKPLLTALVAVALFAALAGAGIEVMKVRRQNARISELERSIGQAESAARAARRDRDGAIVPSMPADLSGGQQAQAVSAPAAVEDAASVALADRWLEKARALRQLIEQNPERRIPQLGLLTDEELLIAAQTANLETEDDGRKALRALRDTAKAKLAPALEKALRAYAAEHDDNLPADAGQLAAYVVPPVTAEMVQQYEIIRSGLLSQVPPDAWVMVDKVPVDERFDSRQVVAANGYGKLTVDPSLYQTARGIAGYSAANDGRKPTTASQIQPFIDGPVAFADIQSRFEGWQAHPDTMGIHMDSSMRASQVLLDRQ